MFSTTLSAGNALPTKKISLEVDMGGLLSSNVHFGQLCPGGKHDVLGPATPGGYLATAAPWLQQFCEVTAHGICSDAAARDWLTGLGVRCSLRMLPPPGIVNAIAEVSGSAKPAIMRIFRPCITAPIKEEADGLLHGNRGPFILGGSFPKDHETLYLESMVSQGREIFYNMSRSADLSHAALGRIHIQISLEEFGDRYCGGESLAQAKYLASKYLAASGAQTIVVTMGAAGSYSLLRGQAEGLFMPTLPLPDNMVVRSVGCGDAHHVGWFLMWHLCRQFALEKRQHRAARFAAVVAAYHAAGGQPTGFFQLGMFERQHAPARWTA